MKPLFSLLTILLLTTSTYAEKLDYHLDNGQFVTSKGVIPKGCFAQLMTELNGDNTIAAIYLNRASLRGCVDANFPYPGGEPQRIKYKIKKDMGKHKYLLQVCEAVDGSMGASCDNIIVKFVNRDYSINGTVHKVLSLEKIGEMT